MKKLATALLALALAAPAAQAQAPFDPSVVIQFTNNITDRRTGATGFGGEGGGFSANFSVDFPDQTRSFSDYLLWCIDVDRGVQVPSTVEYQMYTVQSFAAGNFGSPAGYDVTAADMGRIVSFVNQFVTNWNGLGWEQRNDIQGSIWQTFRGQSTYPNSNTPILSGDANFDTSEWYVMYNGQGQTFLVKVAEPGTLAIVMLGLSMVGFMAIRRRTV